MNKIIASCIGFFLVTNLAFGASSLKTTTGYQFQINYDKNNKATVTVLEKTTRDKKTSAKTIDTYKATTQSELAIVTELAREYNISIASAISQSKFTYAKLPAGTFSSKKDSYSVSYKHKENKTVMTIRINGVSHDYWMNSRNLKESVETLAAIYRVPQTKFWNSVKTNKTIR